MFHSLLVRGRIINGERCPEDARLVYPVGGELVTEGIDLNMPEMVAFEEMLTIAMSYGRHPPSSVLEELKRRAEAMNLRLRQRVGEAIAESN